MASVGNAQATLGAATRPYPAAAVSERLDLAGSLAVFGVGIFVQFSISIAQVLLAIALVCWVAGLATGRERLAAPTFFWPLLMYGAWTLVSAAFSTDPSVSLVDSKQILLFFIVPVTYRFVTGARGSLLLTVIMSVGAASAAFGLFQWAALHYDELGQRPQGMLGHYMTYSGLLMLVIGIAVAKLLFGKGERVWAALVMPALVITVALTLSRNAWVGTFVAVALLLAMKDYRLLAALPLAIGLTIGLAGPAVNARVFSMFNSQDATRLDRVAMLREGVRMVQAHPLVGVGPDMVKRLYEQYRVEGAIEKVNPHLHNVPVQIAAERGLPALLAWLTFIGLLARDLLHRYRAGDRLVQTAAAIAAVVAMLAGGLFEYNFGDSEFLMLFLLIVTLPSAIGQAPRVPSSPHA